MSYQEPINNCFITEYHCCDVFFKSFSVEDVINVLGRTNILYIEWASQTNVISLVLSYKSKEQMFTIHMVVTIVPVQNKLE